MSRESRIGEGGRPAGAPVVGDWIWLFPLGYAAHIAEELWGGPGFPAWISEVSGATLTAERFVSLNAVFYLVMLVAVVMARWAWGWVIVVLGTVVGINGLLHAGASALTGSYSPGVATGLLVWLPLAAGSLRWGRDTLPPSRLWASVALGALVHALIAVLAFSRAAG